jgi:hypothetical protein
MLLASSAKYIAAISEKNPGASSVNALASNNLYSSYQKRVHLKITGFEIFKKIICGFTRRPIRVQL